MTSLQEQLSRHEQEIENYKEKYQMKVPFTIYYHDQSSSAAAALSHVAVEAFLIYLSLKFQLCHLEATRLNRGCGPMSIAAL